MSKKIVNLVAMEEINKAKKILCSIGLIEKTTKRQENNETLYFLDPETGCHYSITKVGYARRHPPQTKWWTSPHYQLNTKTGAKPNGFFQTQIYDRVLLPGQYAELAKIIERVVPEYRKTHSKAKLNKSERLWYSSL